jgi:hypothetical protein
MKNVGLLVFALFMLIARASAAEMRASTQEVRKEIVAVIEAQLAAFRKGDVNQAYKYAAEELRAQKPLQTFTNIVKTNYPEIWSNARAEFGIVRDDGARAAVTVQVYSNNGDVGYDFTLVKERAGWRIHGVLRHEPKKAGKA